MSLNNNNINVIISEQPSNKVHFRYATEKRNPETIYGISNKKSNRTYPTIQIINYEGKLCLDVTPVCVPNEGRPTLHPHRLIDKQYCQHGCYHDEFCITRDFPFYSLKGVGVEHCIKDDFDASINEKAALYPNFNRPTSFEIVNKSQILLCFMLTFYLDNTPITYTFYSDVINDKKKYCKLTIDRLSKAECIVDGGEEIFILCGKIRKDDIQVVLKDPITKKEMIGEVSEVFREIALIFKVPPYYDLKILNEVQVDLFLRQPSLAQDGNSKIFTYLPNNDPYFIKDKKRKINLRERSYNGQNFDQPFFRTNNAQKSSIFSNQSTHTTTGNVALNEIYNSSTNINLHSNDFKTNNSPIANQSQLPQTVISMQSNFSHNTQIPEIIKWHESQAMTIESKIDIQSSKCNQKLMPANTNSDFNNIFTILPHSVTDFNWDENSIVNTKYGSQIISPQNTDPIPIFFPDFEKLSIDSIKDEEFLPESFCENSVQSLINQNSQSQFEALHDILKLNERDGENILVDIKMEDIEYLNKNGFNTFSKFSPSCNVFDSNSQNISDLSFASHNLYKPLDSNVSPLNEKKISDIYLNDHNLQLNAGQINSNNDQFCIGQFNNDEVSSSNNINMSNINESNPTIAFDSNCNLNQLNFVNYFDEVTDDFSNLDEIIFNCENLNENNILTSEELLELVTGFNFDPNERA